MSARERPQRLRQMSARKRKKKKQSGSQLVVFLILANEFDTKTQR